jgi:hypothetical protein
MGVLDATQDQWLDIISHLKSEKVRVPHHLQLEVTSAGLKLRWDWPV